MKKTLKILVVLTILLSYSNADAQIFKKLGKKITKMVEKKTEQKIEKKSSEVTDKVLDSVFEKPKTPKKAKQKDKVKNQTNNNKNSTESLGGFGNIMAMMGKDVTVEEQYTFTSTITMEQYGKNASSGSIKQSISDNAVLSETGDTKLILDINNNATITLMEATKEAQTMSLDMIEALSKMGGNSEDGEEETAPPTITNLSGTKKIMGYSCKGVKIEFEDMIMEIWHTDQINIDTSSLIEFASKISGKLNQHISSDIFKNYGFPMQTEIINNDDSISYGTKVTNIDNEFFTIKMKDYKLIKNQNETQKHY